MWLIPRSQDDFRYLFRRCVLTKSKLVRLSIVVKEWNVWSSDVFEEGLDDHRGC